MQVLTRAALCAAAGAIVTFGTAAQAGGFINGGFENGTASGWTQGGGYRGNTYNPDLVPASYIPGDGGSRSAVIDLGTIDPNVGSALGSTVYSGSHSFRVEDTTYGGNASVIQQRVNNYTDSNIFFAWKSVLLGAHGALDAATMIITLTDLTANKELIRREYNATGSSIDGRFSSLDGNYYTPLWQIEQLAIDATLSGHDFLLSVLGADCQPTGHWGYVYLDGFGAVTPPTGGVPEPATWSMMITGFGLAGMAVRRRRSLATA
ncbi:PEPxxWA-CTERM sorting domain-containing protein [Glacieibacterium sp.]|uniref:PEPxxWA-CTERM sorting domain-containing protein n=1 Tax=Glacieibacterium sp. TaxID=2860237 RepID=UPI003B00953C